MFKNLSNFILKFKWLIIFVWVAVAVVIFLKAPILSNVARNNQQSFLPSNSPSVKAAEYYKNMFPNQGNGCTLILTLERNSGLTDSDKDYAAKLEKYLNEKKSNLDISEIMSPFSNKTLEKQLLSENGKASLMLINISVPSYKDNAMEIVKKIRQYTNTSIKPPSGLNLNVTGDAPLLTDEQDIVNKSMNTTTKITIFLVLAVLIVIYRSPVAPIVPLSAIGLSIIISTGVVAALTKLGFKVSSYTEMFIIAVLFGAGTDYCLLIISRFKEELSLGKSTEDALSSALPNTVASVISSGGTVIVGFLFMGLAKFGLFNTTGPSVAIALAVTLLAVITLIPALLAILGKKMFWPFDKKVESKSVFWQRIADSVVSKPMRYILITLIIFIPFSVFSKYNVRSFDQLSELPINTDSVKGFATIKNNFNQGEMLPVKVFIKTDKNLWSNTSLNTIENLADNLTKLDKVSKVRTATRPDGNKIKEAGIEYQISTLREGLVTMQDGVKPMTSALSQMQNGLNSTISGLSLGSEKIKSLGTGLDSAGNGINQISTGMNSMIDGGNKASNGLLDINNGFDKINQGIAGSAAGVADVSSVLSDVKTKLALILIAHPEVAGDINYQIAFGTVQKLIPGVDKIKDGLGGIHQGISENQQGILAVRNGIMNISSGLNSSKTALVEINSGIFAARDGSILFLNSLNTASTELNKMSKGISQEIQGLQGLDIGLGQVNSFTKAFVSSGSVNSPSFYIPQDIYDKNPELKKAMNYYISNDGKGIMLEVVLSTPPYTNEALEKVSDIEAAVKKNLKGTSLENSEVFVGGPTAIFNDIKNVTSKDFIKVMAFVLLGIFIVLMLLLRSVTAPIYLLLTILLSYTATMGIAHVIFQVILGYQGLNWAVPFFTFCVLVALGIDYNIFLMSRVKEEYSKGSNTSCAVNNALSNTGRIITSCGIIMAGTFGAMMAASVKSMAEVGFATVIGLLLDTFIIRCLLVPSIAVKLGKFNWWPFKNN